MKEQPVDDDSKWAVAALIIRGRPGDVDRITAELEASPKYRFIASRSKMPPQGIWCWDSGLEDTYSLDQHIEQVLLFIREHKEILHKLTKEFSLELSCGFGSTDGQGTFCIPPRHLSLLGSLCITLVLDLYPP